MNPSTEARNYLTVLKSSDLTKLLELYDRLPQVSLKIRFRSNFTAIPVPNNFVSTFGYLAAAYLDQPSLLAYAKDLSWALYEMEKINFSLAKKETPDELIGYADSLISSLKKSGLMTDAIETGQELIKLVGSKQPVNNLAAYQNIRRLVARETSGFTAIPGINSALIPGYIAPPVFPFSRRTSNFRDSINFEKENKLSESKDLLGNLFDNSAFTTEQSNELKKSLRDVYADKTRRLDFTKKEDLDIFQKFQSIMQRRENITADDKEFLEEMEVKYGVNSSLFDMIAKPAVKKCVACHGTGKKVCTNCNGSGQIRSNLTPNQAMLLMQSGTRPIFSESCRNCYGSGKVTCSTCKGTGKEDS